MPRTIQSPLTPPLVLACILLGACASTPVDTTPQANKEPVYFPAAPNPPRIQHLVSFDKTSVWAKSQAQETSFSQWVVGEEKPRFGQSDRIDTPYGVAAYKGKIYICDVGLDKVHVMDIKNGTVGVLGSPDMMGNPVNITIDTDGTKYLCDTGKRQVFVFDANDKFVRQFGDVDHLMPIDLAIEGDTLFIADLIDGQVELWSKDGTFLRAISSKGTGPDQLSEPTNLAIGPDHRIYVADTDAQQIKVFDQEGKYQGSIGRPGNQVGSFARPKGIAIDPHGNVYVVDAQWNVVQVFNTDGQLLVVISGMNGAAPGLLLPATVCLDATSIDAFRSYLSPNFVPEYLIFLVNQYGRNKVSVYAYGRDKNISEAEYLRVMDEARQRQEEQRKKAQEAAKEAGK